MKWLLIVALTACVSTTPQWHDSLAHDLVIGPYVMLTAPQSALVAFRAQPPKPSRVEWSTSDGMKGTVIAEVEHDDLYHAVLTQLPIGPKIDYKVIVGDKVKGAGSFRMGVPPGESKFRFVVFGDTRTNHQVHRDVIAGAVKQNPDFYLHTGDMVEFGGDPEQWLLYFGIERPLMEHAPILPAIGNHDLGNRGYYNRYFFLDMWTKGERYFVTDWGNVRFVALDLNVVCSGCSQYEFVRSALEEGAKQKKLMVMFLHYPPYSSGAHGSNLELREVMGKLAKTYGVELVITGHDHDYERTKSIDGTTYIVSGSAGATIRPVMPHDFTAHARTEPHFVVVDVDHDQLTVRAINLKGEVFDSVVIPDNPPQP
ncbi:MAG: metallophosphoesterase [Kofleriaceae bacterium]